MSRVGAIVWTDLTIPNAKAVRDFYHQVVGWESTPVDMGDHEDFSMNLPGTDTTVAGVCHSMGDNKDLPPQWLIYILVANLDDSLRACQRLGGTIISGPRSVGNDRFCVIQDPAGAVAALYEKAETT